MVLLWRAIVHKTQEELQRLIDPTSVAKSVLSKEDGDQIATTEEFEGRVKAVDELINKLLKLKNLRWTRLFPMALKKQHPDVYAILTEAKSDLLKNEMFSRCKFNVTDTIDHNGGFLELPEFDVHLEVPPGAIPEEETLSVSIVTPDHDHPPLGNNLILAPMVLLEPDGIPFQKPITLTVGHSGVDLKLRHLQVWYKTRNAGMKTIIHVVLV